MMAMGARERMLGRLRAAVQEAASTQSANGALLDRQIHAHYRQQDQSAPATGILVERMETALRASRADVVRATADTWPALLADRIVESGIRRLLLDPMRSEGKALQAALPESVRATPYVMPIESWKAELFKSVDAGFTVAQAGIAATGTLVLVPDPGTPRTVSLVPPHHIALVYARSLYPDLYSAMRGEGWSSGMPSNLVLASGPSKTSDIQQTLAYGAHGPRWMSVVIVMDETAEGAHHA